MVKYSTAVKLHILNMTLLQLQDRGGTTIAMMEEETATVIVMTIEIAGSATTAGSAETTTEAVRS